MKSETVKIDVEKFNKICDVAELSDEQRDSCGFISIECRKHGYMVVKVEYIVMAEED